MDSHAELREYVRDTIWICRYPVRYMATEFDARMTVFRLLDGSLMLHSPCAIDDPMKIILSALGRIAYIVAPGTYHTLHVASAQAAFPRAETFVCPGVERRCPQLQFDGLLGDIAPPGWRGQLDQVVVRGAGEMSEVAFLHRATGTLVLVDLVENFTDRTPHANWALKVWWKAVFHMWNDPKPAPEYQWGWRDKAAARASLRRILQWSFERVILSHGDLIDTHARQRIERAWQVPLAPRAGTGVSR